MRLNTIKPGEGSKKAGNTATPRPAARLTVASRADIRGMMRPCSTGVTFTRMVFATPRVRFGGAASNL